MVQAKKNAKRTANNVQAHVKNAADVAKGKANIASLDCPSTFLVNISTLDP